MNLQQWQAQAQYCAFKSQRIAYWQGGDWNDDQRPALMLIHGFPTASFDWHAVWDELSTKFRLLAVDMLGFGDSAKPRAWNYSILEQADVLVHVAQHCALNQVHILAHDYGDTVAQELLARDQRGESASLSLQSVCLLNGGLFPETHRATTMQKILNSPAGVLAARLMNKRSFCRSFSAVFGAGTQPSAAELEDYWALLNAGEGTQGIVHKLIRYIGERRAHRARWVGALEQSSLPLRVICGADDPVSGAHMAQRYTELVPNPDVVLLAGIGHYPQCEAPQQVLSAVADFHTACGVA